MSAGLTVLLEPAKGILTQIGQFLVNILLVVIILIVGWVISRLIKTLVVKVLQAVKLDDLADRIELDSIMAKGGIKYSLSELIGVICYWLAVLVTFVIAINAVGLTVAADLLNRVILYVPNIIATIFILILGMFVATLLSNIVQTAAVNAGVSQSRLLGKVAEVVVIIFVIAIALEQLGIGTKIIEMVTGIILGSLGLAAALAFGLGCRDIAEKAVSDLIDKLKKK
jgi:hypothetical protein